MRQILCIFILFYAGLASGAASSSEMPVEPVGSFIDKGNVTLPIAPEVVQKESAKIDIPVIEDSESQKPVKIEPVRPPVSEPAPLSKEIPGSKNSLLSPPPLPPMFGDKSNDADRRPIMPKSEVSEPKTDVKSDAVSAPKLIPAPVPKAIVIDSPPVENKEPAAVAPAASVPTSQAIDQAVQAPAVIPAPAVVVPAQIVVPVIAPVQTSKPATEQVKAPVVSEKPLTVAPVQIVSPVPVVVVPSQEVLPNKIIPELRNHLAKKSRSSVVPIQSVASAPILPAIDPELEKFIHNETQMLLVPDDDVLLGVLSDDARSNYMGYSEYLSLYLQYRESVKKSKQRDDALAFIDDRRAIDGNDIPLLSDRYLFTNAVSHIQDSRLDDLRALVDNYNILDLIDNRGNTLLHVAAYKDNMNLTKWLIMRGANVSAINYDSISPLDIAKHEQYWGVFNLLEAANAQ